MAVCHLFIHPRRMNAHFLLRRCSFCIKPLSNPSLYAYQHLSNLKVLNVVLLL